MPGISDHRPRRLSRRSLLAGLGAASVSAGCVDRIRAVSSWTNDSQVTLEIKAHPVDEDPFAMALARQLADWFQQAGLEVNVLPVAGKELLRQVLLGEDFDVFVTRYPGRVDDPDGLYSLLHSTYAAESGWQNPFGYTSLSTDDLLERQRTVEGSRRVDAVEELQRTLLRQEPFTVLAYPDRVTAFRTEVLGGRSAGRLDGSEGLYGLDLPETDLDRLSLVTTDAGATINLNPLAPEFRDDGLVTGLLYDPLVRTSVDRSTPWLASDLSWHGPEATAATVELRRDVTWHDGRALTASDVEFTYEFLRDTSLGEREEPVTVPRFRGRSSLVSGVSVVDDRTVRIEFVDCVRDVAIRALTVPILPEHVWRERSGEAQVGTVDVGGPTTQALVVDNLPPIGSGRFRFETVERKRRLVLEPFEDHFLAGTAPDELSNQFQAEYPIDALVVDVVGSDSAAVDLVSTGDGDVTISPIGPDHVPAIGRDDGVGLDLTRSYSFYFAGYNARRSPLSNTRFRAVLGRLVDRAYLVDEVFGGYATGAVSPLTGTEWLPPDLDWSNTETGERFLGRDGSVDVDRAREAFADAGYQYDDNDRLIQH